MIVLASDPVRAWRRARRPQGQAAGGGGPPFGRASLDRGCGRRPSGGQVGTEKRCAVEQRNWEARHRAKLRGQPSRMAATSPAPRRRPRPKRWRRRLRHRSELQDDYRAWLDTLPANLEGSRLAEKLQAFVELDLDELQAIEPPRGYGRD